MTSVGVAYCGVECSGNYFISDIRGCTTCTPGINTTDNSFITQKIIQHQTGVASSTYNNNLVPFQVTKGQNHYINQGILGFAKVSSDRSYSSNSQNSNNIRIIHRNTSSLQGSRTALRPGSLAPGGIGVDIKHNSYDRHLAKLKAKNIRPRQNTHNPVPIQGNKMNNISIFNYYPNSRCIVQPC
tara:strand:- start:868 stop:1419 length:552 start_codon:yes stop_codon:yes gene_type:complete